MRRVSRLEDRTRLVYILAASHSGSTLLSMLLATHPEICTIGELKLCALGDVGRYRCSCGRLILDCEFWRGIQVEMRRRGFEFDVAHARTDIRIAPGPYTRALLRPLHRGPFLEACRDAALALSPAWRAHLRTNHRRNAALAASVCALSRSRVIVDSSKNGLRLKYLLRNPDLDVKVVRLLRDGRAVTLTYIDPAQFADAQEPALKGGGMGGSRESERLDAAAAAYQWRRSVEDMDRVFATIPPDQRLDVRYEDVCGRVQSELTRIFRFIGVGAETPRASFRDRESHVVGNGMRLDRTSEVVFDDRWRRSLSRADLQTFEAVAGDVNARLGYV